MSNFYPSATLERRHEDFDLQVSRGQVPGHKAIFRSAYSTHVTTSQNYAVWNRPANYTFPPSASVMTLSSSSAGDTTQSVLITGLDANYDEISEVLTLNGQNAVTSTKSFLRVNDMIVLVDSPAGNLFFGTGTVTAGVPDNVYGFISAGDNQQLGGWYTVPAGHNLFIKGGSVNASLANQNKLVTINFSSTILGVKFAAAKIISSGGYQHYPYTPPLAVPEKTDLLDTATTTDATTSTVTVNLSGILIKGPAAAAPGTPWI